MTQENIIYDFLMEYGWAILSAIICIGVLAYFGVFSNLTYTSTNYKCLAETLCQNQSLELDIYYQNNPSIWCKKEIMRNTSWIIEFKIDNWETLEQMFPECVRGK
jgi:hypothetical protein